ncbi:hypothetical protein F5888DRAFT_1877416 [Russula emetica]|nr:hypothetical protein F5888DRAFT_1877416 [Russula emetica]
MPKHVSSLKRTRTLAHHRHHNASTVNTGRASTGALRDRRGETPRSRDVSGQPIPPSSKRASQQQISTADLRPRESSNGIPNVHPYAAAPSPSVVRASPYGNGITGVSPHRPESAFAACSTGALAVPNGNGAANSDSFLYGSTAKRAEEAAAAAAAREGRTNGMGVYDRGQVSRGVMDQDDEPRRRGFFSFMCCRG